MLQVDKSKRARRDLKEIWSYTAEHWGDDQADRYLNSLDKAIARLSRNLLLGVDFGHVRTDLRRLTVSRHRVFYIIIEQTIFIVRVLHERMDLESHLDEAEPR